MAHAARGAAVLKDARDYLFRSACLLAHIERTLGTQAKFAINRDALAGTDLAVHNLGRLARRGQAPKDLRAHEKDPVPVRSQASTNARW